MNFFSSGYNGGVFGNGSYRGTNAVPQLGRLSPQNFRAHARLSGVGDVSDYSTDETAAGGSPSWVSDVPIWIRDAMTLANTQRLLNLNIQRAQQGLPPLTSAQVAPTINFGVSPEIQSMLVWGGLGLGAVLLLSNRRGRRDG